ncbi:helix-hairpin-helix domain-containing protein [Promicromonospora iranensis]|uniref:Flap endonuclease-1-like 5' DNA nuclease n=1 Tax=Promicromonospora iranensis TaxID=1105144 RepID=A0ABU2CTE2_9MICO|nr:helix-hairpin-helix domain-containing protein [Promicromonospora iranensis]MDR7384613.1 putative flap endonuclease-1-like 5' DNA nuclease [Promicromonospora iranensis]
MGWFIAQSLAFIIIAALIGLAIGIWIGWLVWGRRATDKHSAETAEAASTAAVAVPASGAEADSAEAEAAEVDSAEAVTEEDEEERAGAEPAPTLAVASTDAGAKAGAETPDASSAGTGEAEATPDGLTEADVVAEAEAVARRAAEASAAVQADAGATEAEAGEGATLQADDLQRIEGIGPKIASALVAAGYPTYASIAAANEDELRKAVASQGIRFAPSAASWADQAQYLVDSDPKGLDEYQDYLVGGQERRAKFHENVDYADVDEITDADVRAKALAEDEQAAAAAAAAEPEPEPEPQDLRRIEGIGPKIEATLQAAGYTTYAKIAGASEAELRAALATGGIKFAPAAASWADQARYLVDGDEDGFQEFQDYLVGGQDRAAKFRKDVDYADVDEIEGASAKASAIAADEAKVAAADGGTEPTASEAKA